MSEVAVAARVEHAEDGVLAQVLAADGEVLARIRHRFRRHVQADMINLGAVVRALQQCRELACVQLALPVARLELAVHHLEDQLAFGGATAQQRLTHGRLVGGVGGDEVQHQRGCGLAERQEAAVVAAEAVHPMFSVGVEEEHAHPRILEVIGEPIEQRVLGVIAAERDALAREVVLLDVLGPNVGGGRELEGTAVHQIGDAAGGLRVLINDLINDLEQLRHQDGGALLVVVDEFGDVRDGHQRTQQLRTQRGHARAERVVQVGSLVQGEFELLHQRHRCARPVDDARARDQAGLLLDDTADLASVGVRVDAHLLALLLDERAVRKEGSRQAEKVVAQLVALHDVRAEQRGYNAVVRVEAPADEEASDEGEGTTALGGDGEDQILKALYI